MTWPTKKLREICEIRMGETLIKKDLTGDGVPVYSADSLEKAWGYTSKNKLRFKKGAIIIGARGTLGSVKLPNDEEFTSTQTTIIINPQQLSINSSFLFYYLRIVDFKKFRGGSGIPMLTVNQLSDLEIPLPPLSIQQKIVDILDTIQEGVKTQEKIIGKTKELKKS
ncbi:MAG: restriction endonuclease subunit S, partial [Candidatus Pacebacteria bacterium]|nr:restriction endonuclease subunit S [Candidatus Paceibacterota bacterium]